MKRKEELDKGYQVKELCKYSKENKYIVLDVLVCSIAV